jgi:hypothetical protein
MGIFEVVSLILNLLLGSGMIVTLVTLKSARRKAAAEAKSTEINNVDSVAKMWRELAEEMSKQYDEVSLQVKILTKEVNKLRLINSKIVKLLDRITPENMLEITEKIKEEISNGEEINHAFVSNNADSITIV